MSVSGFRLAENGGDDIQTPKEVIICSNGSNKFRAYIIGGVGMETNRSKIIDVVLSDWII